MYSSSLLPFLEFVLGYSKAPVAASQAAPESMCLPTVTQVELEHMTQCISLVHADVLRIAP